MAFDLFMVWSNLCPSGNTGGMLHGICKFAVAVFIRWVHCGKWPLVYLLTCWVKSQQTTWNIFLHPRKQVFQIYLTFRAIFLLPENILRRQFAWNVQKKKKVREKSRECHNHKPQPFPDPIFLKIYWVVKIQKMLPHKYHFQELTLPE